MIYLPGPNMRAVTSSTDLIASGLFIRTFVALVNSTVAISPNPLAMDSTSSLVKVLSFAAFSSENTRTVAPNEADSGITFVVAWSPALTQPMFTITGSKALKRLVTIV